MFGFVSYSYKPSFTSMGNTVAFIGFGEAAQAFSSDERWAGKAHGYDIKIEDADLNHQKVDDFRKCRVINCHTLETALQSGEHLVSLVTADQSLIAATTAAPFIESGQYWFDMNSVSPNTKKQAAEIIEERGARYIDVAIMSPVHPKQLDAPLLISGENAAEAREHLIKFGFTQVNIVGDEVGKASTIKMLRSVMIKGIEALTAECVLAAYKAEVIDDVLGSLGAEWPNKANYNFERMMAHGQRRAAEMREVEKTLHDLGISPLLTAGVVQRQQAIGDLDVDEIAGTLWGKLVQIDTSKHKFGGSV